MPTMQTWWFLVHLITFSENIIYRTGFPHLFYNDWHVLGVCTSIPASIIMAYVKVYVFQSILFHELENLDSEGHWSVDINYPMIKNSDRQNLLKSRERILISIFKFFESESGIKALVYCFSCPPRTFLPALCKIFLDECAPDNVLEVTARAITYYLDVSGNYYTFHVFTLRFFFKNYQLSPLGDWINDTRVWKVIGLMNPLDTKT